MKRTKKIRRTPALKGRERRTAPTPPALPPVSHVEKTDRATVAQSVPAPPTPPFGKRPVARFRRANATPAQRRGADLVRYLRIHLKRPYGDRGIRELEKLAVEVAHLANLELDSRESK